MSLKVLISTMLEAFLDAKKEWVGDKSIGNWGSTTDINVATLPAFINPAFKVFTAPADGFVVWVGSTTAHAANMQTYGFKELNGSGKNTTVFQTRKGAGNYLSASSTGVFYFVPLRLNL